MSRIRTQLACPFVGAITALTLLSCSQVIGLSEMSVDDSAGKPDTKGCTTNKECTDAATQAAIASGTAGANEAIPAVCLKTTSTCATLVSEDCKLITGDYLNDQAVVIGSLFQTEGTTATQNIPRQQSAILAVEEVNAAGGGIPSNTAGTARPLVMVSCNSATDLVRATRHLVDVVKVPAIVGPNTSQDTLDVSNKVTIAAGVAVLSPTAVAASISDLLDNDLTWLMIPSDDQRAELMKRQINDVEATLRVERGRPSIKLSIIYRNDALGTGTRTSLDKLVFNGKPLADPSNGAYVHVVPYDFKQADQAKIVEDEAKFAPDIVVAAGTAESITKVLTPLERAWDANNPRPYYFIIDPSKGPELLAAVEGDDDLRRRVRGTGTKPAAESESVANAFNLDYKAHYGEVPTASGAGTSYDAAYAIAYALAATKDLEPSGANIAKGLRKLKGGSARVTTGTQDLLLAFQQLASGNSITAFGTACPLDWDANGTVNGGTIDMWCIARGGDGKPLFQSSGLVLKIGDANPTGKYEQCGP